MVVKRLDLEYGVVYENLCTLYRERTKQRSKNDHAMRKSPGKSFWVRALIFNLCKEHPPKLYENEFKTESDNWCLND
jgi:hypothetical protein